MIAGFEHPTEGTVMVSGRRVERPSPDRAVVFQTAQLFPWLTVRENIEFGPRNRGANRRELAEQVAFFLEETGLTGFEHFYPYQLSGGMRQRVSIARALINRPQVLLMDEPFGALDAQTKTEMQELLLSVWKDLRPTVLFVTHDVEEAIFLGHRVGIMSRRPGRIKAELAVPIPPPRSLDVITSPEFVDLKRQVLDLIRAEHRPPAARRASSIA